MSANASTAIDRGRTPEPAAEPLPILIAPHRVLKARARPVGPADDAAVRELVPRMFAAMYRAPGIGLAAPQVGQRLRVITVDLMPDDKRGADRP